MVGDDTIFYHLLVTIGLFGLVASFHGIILIAGRAVLEFGRVGYLPRALGRVHAQRKTPMNALLVNMLVGFGALFTGHTDEIITLAVFGALTLYTLSMLSLFKLRTTQPELERPYRAPLYPALPMAALVLAAICLTAVTYYNQMIALIFVALMISGVVLGSFYRRVSQLK